MIVVDGDVHDSVTIPIAHDKFVFQALHFYLVDWSNKGQSNRAAKKDVNSQLLGLLDTEEVNNYSGILLLLSTQFDSFLIGIVISKGLNHGDKRRNLGKN